MRLRVLILGTEVFAVTTDSDEAQREEPQPQGSESLVERADPYVPPIGFVRPGPFDE